MSKKSKNDETLKKRLTPLQYTVTQENGTEPPFQNAYWDNKAQGIYVDVVSGEPLFASTDKFDSGTGWPSFTQPLVAENIVSREDRTLLHSRIEIRSKNGDSHLGHVFKDGPQPTGLRYCINSAALRFIPVDQLDAEGYSKYRKLFQKDETPTHPPQKVINQSATETATFAAGCFWGVEAEIRKIPGVIDTVVGYTGGNYQDPTYEDIKTGKTHHAEAVQIQFDPTVLSYETLLHYFFRLHDPTTLNRQGNDTGTQYRSAIFYHSDTQRDIALKVKEAVDSSQFWSNPVVTEIVPSTHFYRAESYHQDYLQKNPDGYTCHYLREDYLN